MSAHGTPAARLDAAMTAMLVGLGVTFGSLVVQGMAATAGVEAIGALMAKRLVGIHLWRNGAATLLLIALYHSAVNYTTLGYGDIVMSKDWRLLGPQEAACGTLAFGWSTAALVTIVIRLGRYRHRAQMRRAQVREGISRALAKNS